MKFSYTAIEGYCTEMHQIAQNMKEILEYINQNTNMLFQNGYWEGPGASYYFGKFSNISNQFEEVYREIENSILFLAQTAEGYGAMDKKLVAQICNGLNISEPSLATSKIFD